MSLPAYPAYRDSGVAWLGRVPAGWGVALVKSVASCNDDVLPEDTTPDQIIEYVEISDVEADRGITRRSAMAFGDAPSRARRRVRPGDVLVSTVRTYLRAIATVPEDCDALVVSTGFAVFRPRRVHPGFLSYVFHSEYLISEIIARSVGVSYPAINASEIARLPIPLPPPAEQRAIAAFLDRECGKIDALVAEQERLIALLKEKRQAVISHAVTKDLDPTAPMKDSGVAWLGQVPAHWEVVRGRRIFVERDERSEDGDETLLTVSHLTGVTPRAEKTVYMFEAETTEGYKRCHRGDLVINTLWAWMGAMGVAGESGIVSPAYHVYRPKAEVEPGYVNLLVRMGRFAREAERWSKGVWSSRLRLYPEEFLKIEFPLPPLAEQRAIAAFLNRECGKIATLTTEAERAIALLKERRAALISAAVTGRIDVRGLVPAEEAKAA